MFKKIHILKYSLLPILFISYPVIFHYRNNIGVALFLSALKLMLAFIGGAFILYLLFLFFDRFQPVKSANASTVIIFFFLTYGLVFNGMREWDVVQVEHYSLLPAFLALGLYFSWLIYRLNQSISLQLWKGILTITAGLLIFNLIPVLYVIIEQSIHKPQTSLIEDISNKDTSSDYPDIYYIVFDEMAGFEPMRHYWKYDGVDEFKVYLQKEGFYVAENSHGSAPSTLNQLASRFNYTLFPYDKKSRSIQAPLEQQAIINNKSMQYLKSLGYTTVTLTGINSAVAFEAMPSINSDFAYDKVPDTQKAVAANPTLDAYSVLVLNNTLFLPLLEGVNIEDITIQEHRDMIYFTIDIASSPSQFPSPKFVFIHILTPHIPFVFDPNGRMLDSSDYYNWDKYLGQYIYATKLARELLDNILSSADYSISPPVIIFQSDHGARNGSNAYTINHLVNYPDEYKTWIVNALLLPGCEDAPLTQDMDPINTFPIIFNCYFDANIPLQ